MSALPAASGFDLEIVAGEDLVSHLLQLLMDTGLLDPVIPLTDTATLTLLARADVRRTYAPYPGTDYALYNGQTFALNAVDPGGNPGFLYLRLGLDFLRDNAVPRFDLYLRVREDIDVQDEVSRLLAWIDETPDADGIVRKYRILDLIRIETVLPAAQAFDTANPENNDPGFLAPVVATLNGSLEAFIDALKAGTEPEALAFLRSQVDPFAFGALERLALRPFPADNRLAFYVNLRLLDHARGWLPRRGDPAAGQDLLASEPLQGLSADLALATSPGFLRSLVDTLLLKHVAGFQVGQDLLSPDQARALLDGDHFPLHIPKELVAGGSREEDEGEGLLRFQVTGTSLATRPHTYKDADGRESRADSLEIVLKTNASLGKVLGLANENLVAHLTPLAGLTDSLVTADLGLDTSLRVDLVKTLVSLANPLNIFKVATLPIMAVVNLFANASDAFAGVSLSSLGIDLLARLPLKSIRWDPFYTTAHGFLLERRLFGFADDQAYLAATLHLSKTFRPVESVWVREAEIPGEHVSRLRYQAEGAAGRTTGDHYATDREDYREELDDPERDIFSLDYDSTAGTGNVRARLAADKLLPLLPYTPYATTQGTGPGHYRIESLHLLSWMEEERLEARVLSGWVQGQVETFLRSLEKAGVVLTEAQRKAVSASLEAYLRESGLYQQYMDAGLAQDVKNALYADGTLRLRLPPYLLNSLIKERVLSLPGYEAVYREGRLYFRDIADGSTADNLLSLPTLG